MRSIKPFRLLFTYITTLILLISQPPVGCAAAPPKTPVAPIGQSGSLNLPIALSRAIDQTHMGTATESSTGSAAIVLAAALDAYRKNTLHVLNVDVPSLLKLIREPRTGSEQNANSQHYQFLYVGSEVVGGSGTTNYGVPEAVYSNVWRGYDLGTVFVTSAGHQDRRPPDSFGVSFKYEVTGQGRALAREVHDLDAEGATFEAAQSPSDADVYKAASLVASSRKQLLKDYKVKSQELAFALVGGSRLISGGGSLSSEGISASKLIPFGDNAPGVTLLYAFQGFYSSLRHDSTRGALQNGAALIFQDRTPAINEDYLAQALSPKNRDYLEGKTKHSSISPLRPTWRYKLGAEYTAPILGLTKAYSGFVRYRDPKTYFEVTLGFGEDGLGKDYGSVSIGRSIAF